MGMTDDMLLEPSDGYKKYYKPEFENNANALFDSLVSKSHVNVEMNRKTAEEYRNKSKEVENFKKKRGKFIALQVTLIVLAVIALFVLLYGILVRDVLTIVIPAVCIAVFLILILGPIRKKLKSMKKELEKLQHEADELYGKAMEQMHPLLSLFDNSMTFDLIRKTVPQLELDDSFNMKRYDYMHGKYGLSEQPDDETSTLGILSGQIIGNPFMFERVLHHKMGMQTYTGRKTISWTTYSTDSNGRRQAHHHTQTLVAHVRKPKPFYSETTRLIYGNDAAPDLRFSREKTHCERLDEKKLRSTVKSKTKEIQKKSRKDIASGFTGVGNEEFDALFGALDRDNEVQFRLLFTPLAQRNMLALMKGGSPYGDDFDFFKNKQLNCVISEHSQDWDMDTDATKYNSYDIDICRKLFVSVNLNYFTSMYFDMAPLLSIPMYQQIMPEEYIYGTEYERNYTARETEILANRMKEDFVHPATRTRAILKTELISKTGNVDKVRVTAYSYRAIHRVEIVMVHGGDGHIHAVPVPWIQYIPVSKQTDMSLKAEDMAEKERDESKSDGKRSTIYHKLCAMIGDDGPLHDDSPDEKGDGNDNFSDIVESEIEEFDNDNQSED